MSDDSRDAWLAADPLPAEPISIVKRWLSEAFAEGRQESPHAIALATVDADGRPSVRMVLCSDIDVPRGGFTFHTNRESRKGRALAADPRAAIAFNWPGRQVRIEGVARTIPDVASDAYFAARPLESRLGAWASLQSEVVESRAALLETLAGVAARFDARNESDVVPRPPNWGGYVLLAERAELWVSRRGRIHDRALWTRVEGRAGSEESTWRVDRLQP